MDFGFFYDLTDRFFHAAQKRYGGDVWQEDTEKKLIYKREHEKNLIELFVTESGMDINLLLPEQKQTNGVEIHRQIVDKMDIRICTETEYRQVLAPYLQYVISEVGYWQFNRMERIFSIPLVYSGKELNAYDCTVYDLWKKRIEEPVKINDGSMRLWIARCVRSNPEIFRVGYDSWAPFFAEMHDRFDFFFNLPSMQSFNERQLLFLAADDAQKKMFPEEELKAFRDVFSNEALYHVKNISLAEKLEAAKRFFTGE